MTNAFRCCFSALVTTASFSASADILKLGNEPQAAPFISGPQKIETRQGRCHYSLVLGKSFHARYNDPEIILYQSPLPLKDDQIPHLEQAETSSGYYWMFSNPGSKKTNWFGLMCDSVENFPFGTDSNSEAPPELEQALESNGIKCPAELRDGKFFPKARLFRSKDYSFKRISYNNWNGFIITHKAGQSEYYDQIRFCLTHNDRVIVGATENQSPLPKIDNKFPDEVEGILKTLVFSEDN